MPALSTKPNRFYPSIPAITGDAATHESSLRVIREAIETHERRNNNYLKSFIRFEELVELGIINSSGEYVLDTGSGGAEINDLTAAVVWDDVPDANITLTSVSQHLAAISKGSIEVDALELQLVNDVGSPGNSQLYGTSAGGIKGWYAIPTGGTEVNDLTAAVVWDDIPIANVPRDFADNLLQRPDLRDYALTHQTLTVAANAVTVDLELGNSAAFDMDPATADVVLTLSNPPAAGIYGEVNLLITIGTPAHGITWPGSVVWQGGGTEPTLSTANNAVDAVHLFTIDGGANWYGTFALSAAGVIPTHTGHVTGQTSLSLVVAAITGQIDIGANLVGTDEIVVNDNGDIRRADVSRLNNYLNGALAFAAASHNHNTSDINAGTLVVGRGGTGVTASTGTGNTVRSANATLTGTTNIQTLEMTDNILRRPYIDDYALFRATITATAITTLNYSTAQVYAITMNASITTLSISNEPASGRYGEMTLKLIYNSGTARTVDWSDIGVKWGEPGEPTLTSVSGKHDVIHIWTDDGGASWYGSYILNY